MALEGQAYLQNTEAQQDEANGADERKNKSLFKISVAMYNRELCVTISFASFLPLYLAKRTYPPRNTSIVTSCSSGG